MSVWTFDLALGILALSMFVAGLITGGWWRRWWDR